MISFVVSPDSPTRRAHALAWLGDAAPAPGRDVLLVAASREAADDLARAYAVSRGATSGIHRVTLDRLAVRLALPRLVERGRAPASGLALQAVVARTVFMLHGAGELRYFAPVGHRPGFPAAVGQTLSELRMEGVRAAELPRPTAAAEDLARIAARFEEELEGAGLADRAEIYRLAAEAAREGAREGLLLLDVRLRSTLERQLVESLAAGSARVCATVPTGDVRTARLMQAALGCEPHEPAHDPRLALDRLKRHLFAGSAPEPSQLDPSLDISSWPGEARECVEIARALQREAAAGTPFDRMAVLLRAPQAYRAHLEEALARAEIPAWVAGGAARPHASGRALLALLACAAERLSARRFAEYLSLAQVPEAAPTDEAWQPPRHELAPGLDDLAPAEAPPPGPLPDPEAEAVVGGTLRAPWRWENLMVEAAVLGGRDRWARRLRGLVEQLRRQRAMLAGEEEGRVAVIDQKLADLSHLEAFALPLVDHLAALPRRASWGEWLPALRVLAARALRDPAFVLEALAELEPMAPVGPVDLDEVRLVLTERLQEVAVPPPRRRYGAVFVAPVEAARGMQFDVVFVPGLVEKGFPQPVGEDPILLDAARAAMREAGVRLDVQSDRATEERLALRLACGAAARRLVLSYPRIDADAGRPRVPSFYALESLRAAEGKLLGFETLNARLAVRSGGARLGWPAPERREEAIDAAEYDLSLIAPLLTMSPDETVGTASYLLGANPHLARALRARARRWREPWSRADGLDLREHTAARPHEKEIDALAREALAAHRMAQRSFSPTALQHWAGCPYRFFLQAVQRLSPRDEMVAPEVLDPLTRGSLFHEVQFVLLSRLQARGELPITEATEPAAVADVDAILAEVERGFRDEVAPAIERVWDDGIAKVRADLREWVRRQARDDSGWMPHRFELSFGLVQGDRGQADPHSVREPVRLLDRVNLRGSIDLVERQADGRLRATDHKTGRPRAKSGMEVQGGEILQPLLYALACEVLEPGAAVESGRLYYCTADGGYVERVVPLNDKTRATVRKVVQAIDGALDEGFLPAAPVRDGCKYCDYAAVCGPREAERTERKSREGLRELQSVREMP